MRRERISVTFRKKLIFVCPNVTFLLEAGEMSELIAGLVLLVRTLPYVSEATERITVNFDAIGPH
jgi:hypothetical protein